MKRCWTTGTRPRPPRFQPRPQPSAPRPRASARPAISLCLGGIARRELLRFVNQKERFLSALVRPLIWLFIFAAGFRNVLGVSIEPPYQTYVSTRSMWCRASP